MNIPVFDLHCDTSDKLAGIGSAEYSSLRNNRGHIDLERASSLPDYAQCFACFTTYSEGVDPVVSFERKLTAIHRELSRNEDLIRQAFCANDIVANKEDGRMSAILTIEGPAGFGFDPALLEDLYKIGFRISTLGWNEQNPLTGSHVTGGGLTEQGREYVRQAQLLGMLIDVSHISDEGFWDIIEMTARPVIASHSNSRSVCDVSRNISDDMFRAIKESGGVVGINLYPDFLGENADLGTVLKHIDHFLGLDPDGKHICLGADLDGIDSLPIGFTGVEDFPVLAQYLLDRGLGEELVYNIFWKNALEVFQKCSI